MYCKPVSTLEHSTECRIGERTGDDVAQMNHKSADHDATHGNAQPSMVIQQGNALHR